MSRIDPTSLRLFIAVVNEKSIAAAAERHHIAAAAVSRRLSDLEQTLGTVLLRRTNRGVAPTPAGQSLMSLAQTALNELERIPQEMKSKVAGGGGLVRLCASNSAISQFLPGDLHAFLATDRAVQLHIDERISAAVVQAVRDNAADLGVFTNVQDTLALQTFPYRSDRLVLIAPSGHPLARRRSWTFADTLDHDYIDWISGSAINLQLTDAAALARRAWRLRIRVSGFDALCMMVSSGLGVGILPESVARRNAEAIGFRICELRDAWAERRFMICVRSRAALTAPALRLLEHLHRAAQG
jgi:DNA-binding transcriptional LysR family regulator